MPNRRAFLLAGVAASTLLMGLRAHAEGKFKVTLTDAEWRAKLTPGQYAILRKSGTERPYSSPLNDEHRAGTFACAGCALPLFASSTKFDSGTGWPSFYAPLKDAVGTEDDHTLGMERTAVHCAQCGGHLGHVFPDGPPPTGQRYCMNGLALTFQSQSS
ncbi:MAG TPA: peptide-methionine (R)-S-oxide reductase MsrB [Reyranella sp.]|nr:peptide-methionine (R)-S-oxide reductase MsrB [Reyranella sp.]